MTTKKRTRAARKMRRLVRLCRCRKPSFGLCTPVCMSEEGRALMEANQPFLGRFVCFHCGGVAKGKPEMWDHITGETVIRRLLQLGIART